MEAKQTHKKKEVFIKGPISPQFIGEQIAKHQSKVDIGAHEIFLGQVRADEAEGSIVVGIEYSAYREMADKALYDLREEAFSRFDMSCMHIYHSLGYVPSGQICLFVFVSAAHRKTTYEALRFVVESVKERIPVFGKEILENNEHRWKKNN